MTPRISIAALLLGFGLATVLAETGASGQSGNQRARVCEARNGTSCETCLRNVTCLWCVTTQSCITYPVRTILPPHSVCPLNDARWGLCWMNFQTLIITLAVIGGILIIAFFICLFCCCKCENFGAKRFEVKMQKQADKTRTKQQERKAAMRMKHEEIRKKFGITGPNPYSKFT